MTAHPTAASRRARPGAPARTADRGFTLVELMVVMVIGLTLTLAITGIMTRHERDRRAVSSTNDMALGSASVSYLLDRTLRSAGSGFAQAWNASAGCLLRVSRAGTRILPRSSNFPAPFATVPRNVRLMPVLVHAGAGAGGSDVIAVQAGAAARGEAPLRVLANSAGSGALRVPSTLGLRGDDLVLMLEDGVGCVMQQVAAPFTGGPTQQLTTGGTYAADPVDGVSMAAFAVGASNTGAQLLMLGNTTGNRPQFQLLGIHTNDTLVSYDMLRLDGSNAVVPVAEGVMDLRVRYGVDTNDDGVVDSWEAPTAANWTATVLASDTPAARAQLRRILALRVGLLLRSDRIERDPVSPASITLFSDLDATLHHTRNLTAADQQRRTRAVEFTVPLRNTIYAP